MSSVSHPFVPGTKYNRRTDIHNQFGGQEQGGISTPRYAPIVFLFTGQSGSQYGYRDGFREDGSFWYTGEGQRGDMSWSGGNTAIRDHASSGKSILLFEYVSKGTVSFIGEAVYLGHHLEDRPDVRGATRKAIIFELGIESVNTGEEISPPSDASLRKLPTTLWSIPIGEVRSKATAKASSRATATERKAITYLRSEAVRVYVLRRAAGVCESCGMKAPFATHDGRLYLEPHHIRRLADGGPDDPESVAAICPNCHREIHYGAKGVSKNDALLKAVKAKERDLVST